MDFKFKGTDVVFEAWIGNFHAEITAKAAVCGSKILPDERQEAAISGMLRYLQAVKDGRNARDLEHLQEILQEGRGLRIMAKDPRDTRSPICWDPSQTIFKKI